LLWSLEDGAGHEHSKRADHCSYTLADGKPELAWEEHHAHDVLTAYMEKQEGFTVERKICQLDTAWKASYGTEGPIIGFCSEME